MLDREIVAIHLGNITPAVVDLLYWLAGHGEQEPASVEAIPAAEPSQELLEEVARANQAVGALSLWAGGRVGVDGAPLPALNVGDKLPGFGFVTNQGQNYQLDLAERPQLVNFWASWCAPCRDEFPLLIAEQARPDVVFDVVFVNVWDDPVTYQDYLADYPDDLVAMIDVCGDLPEQYGFEMVPVTLLVDEEGRSG
jgi:cytochrome c biogenesis protein CcmG/thiol:disulfide interchange protein DsbE